MKLLIRLVVTVLLALVTLRLAYRWYGASPAAVSWPVEIVIWSAAFLACYVVVLFFERAVVAPILRRTRA